MSPISLSDVSIPRRATATMPKPPTCELCKGGGYLLPQGVSMPKPCTPAALVCVAMPCGCAAGDEFRRLAESLAQPIRHRDGRVITPGVEVPWP